MFGDPSNIPCAQCVKECLLRLKLSLEIFKQGQIKYGVYFLPCWQFLKDIHSRIVTCPNVHIFLDKFEVKMHLKFELVKILK